MILISIILLGSVKLSSVSESVKNRLLVFLRRVFESLRFVYSEHEFRLKVGVHDQLFLFEAQRLGFRVLLRGDVLCGHLPEWPLKELEAAVYG